MSTWQSIITPICLPYLHSTSAFYFFASIFVSITQFQSFALYVYVSSLSAFMSICFFSDFQLLSTFSLDSQLPQRNFNDTVYFRCNFHFCSSGLTCFVLRSPSTAAYSCTVSSSSRVWERFKCKRSVLQLLTVLVDLHLSVPSIEKLHTIIQWYNILNHSIIRHAR